MNFKISCRAEGAEKFFLKFGRGSCACFHQKTERQFCAGGAEKNALTPHHSLETFVVGVGPHNAVALANFLEIIYHKKN